ncbi:hypothetical protein J2W22_000721 [Sphingomonas kyeonggiensis]|uniref:hypothetical protein n=1 Tax=Sphingomonas kyeonggiensis TaxID=1268553 RepID=UPI00278431AE|nr:hypothetical protein [Sphingomonas kyeonggiensis]MDQ0248674.1 hypothetical protein [Sphingomonas kyeonggiensis]
MKPLACLPLLLLAAASVPSHPEPEVSPATLRAWSSREGRFHWVSDGIRIGIAPVPCGTPAQTEACRWDGHNNQADVTITPAGGAPVVVRTTDQAAYYRLGVVRFNARDVRPGLVIENRSGGAGGDVWIQLFLPEKSGYREVRLPGHLQGELPGVLRDISGDGTIDFVLGDGRFDGRFGCNACTPRPPMVLTLRGGQPVEVSREPGYAHIYREDMARLRPACLSERRDRNGACAAYVADAARIGRFGTAWAEMLGHWEREENQLQQPESLRAFLKKTGYIS